MKYLNNIYQIIIFIFCSNIVFGQNASIFFTSPENGDEFSSGDSIYFIWNSENVKMIRIEYQDDTESRWMSIAKSVEATNNFFKWQIPENISGGVSLRLVDESNANIFREIDINIINSYDLIYEKYTNNLSERNQNTISIMPLGNSITRGSTGSPNKIGYRRKLYLDLIAKGYDIEFVGSQSLGLLNDFDKDHEGHSGWHADHPTIPEISIAENLYGWLEMNPPDIILMHVGTNDIIGLEGNNEDIFDVVDDVNKILDTIDVFEDNYNKEIYVVLAKIILQENDTLTSEFNSKLDSMVTIRILNEDKIILVDQESALNYPDDLVDGIHPTQIGYNKMADTWLLALDKLFAKPVLLTQPKTKGVFVGDSVKFSVMAENSNILKYQWYKNNVPIDGAVNNAISIPSVTIGDNNSVYKCRIYNLSDSIFSYDALLYVTEPNMRVVGGEQVVYNFEEGFGNRIFDNSSIENAVNLSIDDTSSVSWVPHGLELISSSMIQSDLPANKIFNSYSKTNEFTIEAWIAPKFNSLSAPQAITYYSKNSDSINFNLSQEVNTYNLKLSTSETFPNGISTISNPQNYKQSIIHFVFTRTDSGVSKIYIDGVENKNSVIQGNLNNWDSTYIFRIGNSNDGLNPWLGTYFHLSLFNRSLSEDEITNNYNFGEPGITNLEYPSGLALTIQDEKNVRLDWNDNSSFESGFIIERSENNISDEFIVIDSTLQNINYYVDSTTYSGITYFYRIRSFNDYFISNPSITKTITTPIIPPNNLSGFTNESGFVELNWTDNSINEIGFIIEGKPAHPDSLYSIIDSVNANINTYEDSNPKFYTPFEYRVYAYTRDTTSNYSNTVIINTVDVNPGSSELPTVFNLEQNYPNPFNPSSKITFSIPIESEVSLNIYNILGEHVGILINNTLSAGKYEANFEVGHLTSGIYFYELYAKSSDGTRVFRDVKKLIIQK